MTEEAKIIDIKEHLIPVEESDDTEGEGNLAEDVHSGLGVLQASNLARIINLSQKRVGINPLNLLSMRIEALIDATMGPNGDAREAFEFIYESRISDAIDRIEEEIEKPENIEAMARQGGQTPGGLVLPGQ